MYSAVCTTHYGYLKVTGLHTQCTESGRRREVRGDPQLIFALGSGGWVNPDMHTPACELNSVLCREQSSKLLLLGTHWAHRQKQMMLREKFLRMFCTVNF